MEEFNRLRRSQRLSLLSMGLALLIAFFLLVVHQYFVGRRALLDELHTEAAILAENSSAALVFEDDHAGREIVAAIRHTPRILAGALYRPDGVLLAAHPQEQRTFLPRLPPDDASAPAADPPMSHRTTLGLAGGVIREEVRFKGAPVGTLFLHVDFMSLYWRLLEYAGGVLGIAAVALALAYRLTRRLRRRVARTEEQLEQFALYDQVTSLPNRRRFEQELAKAVSRVRRGGAAALLFLDVDGFKKVNDSFGHEVGDRVLRMIGTRLRAALRSEDVVARIGGDEFAVILHTLAGPEDAARVARKLIATISEPFPTEPTPVHVGLSVGIAMMPADGEDPVALLRHADMAMYVVKGQGKNDYQFFCEAIDGKMRHDLQLETDLRQALAATDGGLWVAYQPKLCARTHRFLGVEALARWQTPQGLPVSPAEFIPVAERSGLITALGDWVLGQVCRDLAWLRAAGIEVPKVAVNVSPLQLLRGEGVIDGFCRTLARYGEATGRFEFELTESTLTEARGATVLEALHAAGFSLAIDDFGTGYSSLGYLKRFRVSTLKIDQSFVRDLPDDSETAVIVRAVIQMAHALNISVVAEGVETGAQADFLTGCDCDILQGYLLGRPMSAHKLREYLHESPAMALP